MTAYPRTERRARKRAAKGRSDARKFLPLRAAIVTPGTYGRVVVPRFALPARANTRVHWAQIAAQRQLGTKIGRLLDASLPCTITLTRVSPGKLDSHDGLSMAFKAIVDGIADALVGRPVRIVTKKCVRVVVRGDDSDERLTWRYQQRRGEYAIEVEVS